MIQKIKGWVMKKFLLDYLKSFLDKLPADGKKTALSLLVLLLTVCAELFPQFRQVIHEVIEALKQLGAEVWFSLSIGGAVVGLLHKWLKSEDEKTKADNNSAASGV